MLAEGKLCEFLTLGVSVGAICIVLVQLDFETQDVLGSALTKRRKSHS